MTALVNNTSAIKITPLSGANGPLLDPYITPYVARGVRERLRPITGGGAGGQVAGRWIRRTVSGKAVSLFPEQMRKYSVSIQCTDVSTPVMDDSWIGNTVEVECISELSFVTGGSPGRPMVDNSDRQEGHLTYYRPVLIMLVADIDPGEFDSFNCSYPWRIDLLEV